MGLTNNWTNKKILLVILLAALFLRLPNIGATLAGDEIDTVGPARNYLTDGKPFQYMFCNGTEFYNNTHPPFRVFFYTMWASLFGLSDAAMRLVPLLFGLATIALTYLLGKELYSEKVGLIAAGIAAFSRYHIYASQLVSNDNTLFIFLFEAALYTFVLFKKRNDTRFGILSGALIVLSLYARVTFFVLIPVFLVYSYLNDKKNIRKDIRFLAAAFVIFLASLFALSVAFGDNRIFTGPLGVLSTAAGSEAIYVLASKVFYVATITWQMTPFLALLVLLALVQSKKDNNYFFLAAWLIVPFIIFMAGSGDVQRYYTMALPALFVLVAKFVEGLDIRDKSFLVPGALVIIIAAFLGLNDLMGYYKPEFVAIFYIMAAVSLIVAKRNIILLGAAVGLSIYFAFSPGFIVASGAHAIDLTVDKATELEIPYNQVYTTKDIDFHITPMGESTELCEFRPDKEYLQQAQYIAFYHLPSEAVVRDIATICETPNFIEMDGRTIGVVCKVRT